MSFSTKLTTVKDRIFGIDEPELDSTPETDVERLPDAVDTTITPRPTRAEVLDAIVAEAECTRSLAGDTLAWLKGIVKYSRRTDYDAYYPTGPEMQTKVYDVMDAIMQHGQASIPGSAHDKVERFLLDPTRDETALFHDDTDEHGTRHYCTVRVAIGAIG